MKPALLRSALIGIVVMVLVVLLAGITALMSGGDVGGGPMVRFTAVIVDLSCLARPVGLPLLLLIIAWITWRQTQYLSKDLSAADAKKQLMFSVWVSTAIATSPILLSPVVMASSCGGCEGSGIAMLIGIATINSIWNAFLIFMVGLIAARLMVKNDDKPKEVSS